jgi:hypothetical protein
MAAELEDLEHAVDLANKVDWGGLPGGAKTDALRTVTRVRNKFDALDGSVIGAFESTREHRATGHCSPISWMEAQTQVSGRSAARRRRAAKLALSMPRAHDALIEGVISVDHVEVLHHAKEQIGDDFAIAERAMIAAATDRSFDDFKRLVEYHLIRLRPRKAKDREAKEEAGRWAKSSRTLGGCGYTESWLPPVGYTFYVTELNRLMDHLHAEDRVEAKQRLGRDPLAHELRRTTAQRRADAILLMAERSAAFGDEALPASNFQLVVHGDTELVGKIIDELHDALASEAETFDLDDLQYPDDSLHELEDGTPVTVNTLLLALLTGTVRGVLYDPDGVILRYGRARRGFSPDQTSALMAKFRRCGHPFGCHRTGRWLQADHTPEWEDGGPTDTDEADMKCGPHNRWKHNTKHGPPPEGRRDTDQRRRPPRLGPRDTDGSADQ